MPTETSTLARIEALEAKVATLATTAYVDLRVASISDYVGTLLSELTIIKEKLDHIVVPEDTRFYLSPEEISFIRDGMSTVTKFMVELENLRNELLRLAQQAL